MLTTSSLNIQFIQDLNYNLSNFEGKKRCYEDESDENQMTDLETNENDSDTTEKRNKITIMNKVLFSF